MSHQASISMYVPARNAEAHLGACLEAIHRQTRKPDELFILLDPRSEDRTFEIARSSGVTVVLQQGRTLGAARNEAILHARHRWLASCDSDVVIDPLWLERLADCRDRDVVGIAGRTDERTLNPFDEWRALHMPHHWGDYPLRNPFMLVSEVLFDRQALLNVGGYRDDLNYYEDSDLCQRLREADFDLLYEPSATATHLRSDSLESLLTLRWRYSEYRQRHLLDRYDGLLAKMAVNQEYATHTLARGLARKREDLAYISLLLFFHHALMDLRSLLSRRPLLDEVRRSALETQLVHACVSVVERHGRVVADLIRNDLREMHLETSPEAIELSPSWSRFLERAGEACERFCDQFSEELWRTFQSSGRYVHGQTGRDQVEGAVPADRLTTGRALERMTLKPVVDDAWVAKLRATWPEVGPLTLMGPASDSEHETIRRVHPPSDHGSEPEVILAPHLETRVDPLGVFEEYREHPRLVVCYGPPDRFVAGLDVPSASDLASAASAAGWTIDGFETLVGRVCLFLRRPPASERVCEKPSNDQRRDREGAVSRGSRRTEEPLPYGQ